MRFRETIKSMDWVLFGASILLVAVGLAMLFSATYRSTPVSPFFIRQLVSLGISVAVFFLIIRFPYHGIARYVPFIYGLGISSLIALSVFGAVSRGTVRRFDVFGWNLQPSEFMKIILVLALAWFLARYKLLNWKNLLLSVPLMGMPVAMVMLEPDLGMSLLMVGLWAGLLIFMGLPRKTIVVMGIMGMIIFGTAWHIDIGGRPVIKDYQKTRILTFLRPTSDSLGAGYNVNQAIIALGSGQVMGRGLGHGPQSQLKFLPERHTDFILASIGEELGFVGIFFVLTLYGVLLWRILITARLTQDVFGQLLCVGAFFLLLMSLVVSAGMNMGVVPVTGIALPLVSYGGSSLLSTFALLALVQSVRIHSKWAQAPPAEISHIS